MRENLRVRDIMSGEVTTLNQNEQLTIADDIMRLGRIRHLPVVDDDERIVGIVSQRDLFRSALARAIGYGEVAQNRVMGLLKVKEVMTIDVATIGPDASLAEAADIMLRRKLGCLVVAEENRIVGILTEGDFVELMACAG